MPIIQVERTGSGRRQKLLNPGISGDQRLHFLFCQTTLLVLPSALIDAFYILLDMIDLSMMNIMSSAI